MKKLGSLLAKVVKDLSVLLKYWRKKLFNLLKGILKKSKKMGVVILKMLKRKEKKEKVRDLGKRRKEEGISIANIISMLVFIVLIYKIYLHFGEMLLKSNLMYSGSFIVVAVVYFLKSLSTLPPEHKEAIGFFGFYSRWMPQFGRGLRFAPWGIITTQRRETRLHTFQPETLEGVSAPSNEEENKALAEEHGITIRRGSIRMFLTFQGQYRIVNVVSFFKLEKAYADEKKHPGMERELAEKAAEKIIMGKGLEAALIYLSEHSWFQCIAKSNEAQVRLVELMQEEAKRLGIEVWDIDVTKVVGDKEFMAELTKNERRRVRIAEIAATMKKLLIVNPKLKETPRDLLDAATVINEDVPKEIKKEDKNITWDVNDKLEGFLEKIVGP